MADGAELSLDDYIKVKRKQKSGAFKIGRVGGKVRATGRRVVTKGKGPGQRQGGQVNNIQGQKNRRIGNRNWTRKNNGNNSFQNNAVANYGGGTRRLKNVSRVVKRRRAGQRPGGFAQAAGGISPTKRRQRNRNNQQMQGQAIGISHNLSFGGRPRQRVGRGGQAAFVGPPRRVNNNRRVVVKLARKRVQRARLQLAYQRKTVIRPIRRRGRFGGNTAMPLMSIGSGIRRTRTGFVTVSNPAEKQLQRLVVKEKIQRARQIRLDRSFDFNSSNSGRPGGSQPQPRRGQFVGAQHANRNNFAGRKPQNLPRRQFQGQRQSSPASVNLNRRTSLNQNNRSIPAMGMSMYADQEEGVRRRQEFPAAMAPMQMQSHPQWISSQPQMSFPFPMTRTTYNSSYDPFHPAIDFDEMQHGGLNPDIQRKINFIQTHAGNKRPSSAAPDPLNRSVMTDFRAPTISSKMSLGERFRTYMH